MHKLKLINIHKMGRQVSNQHMLEDYIDEKQKTSMIFFSYETPIYEISVKHPIDGEPKPFIRSFEFYNYMRIFFPQFFNKDWESITLSAMTKRYITFSLNHDKLIKEAFEKEKQYIASIYKDNDTSYICNRLEFLIYNVTGVHYDIATKSIKED